MYFSYTCSCSPFSSVYRSGLVHSGATITNVTHQNDNYTIFNIMLRPE